MEMWSLPIKYATAFFNVYGDNLVDSDFWLIKKAALYLANNRGTLDHLNLYKKSEQLRLIPIILKHFELPIDFNNLLMLLQRHKRIVMLPDILSEIATIFLFKSNKIFFRIESYPALLPAQIQSAVEYLQQQTNCEILYECVENKELITGLRMQSKQLLYENTIKDKLQKIHRKLIRQH